MKVFLCTGHADYGKGVISSADGRSKGGCNEYLYNVKLIKAIAKYLKIAGCDVDVVVPNSGELHSLNDEINYYIGKENAGTYDLSVQLHLNSFDGNAKGCEVWYYSDKGNKYAIAVDDKLCTVWKDRGVKKSTSLYWLRRTKSPAILIESFFCDSKVDYLLADSIGFDAHGKLIAEGIVGHDIVVKPTYHITATYDTKKKKIADKMFSFLRSNGLEAKVERR